MYNLLLITGLDIFVFWLVGLITSFTLGGSIHILLVIGIVFIIIWSIICFKRCRKKNTNVTDFEE